MYQLLGYHAADQCLCFQYIDSTILLLSKYGCTVEFVSDLVGKPEDRFSHNAAHLTLKLVFS